jgi:hypothetical protein
MTPPRTPSAQVRRDLRGVRIPTRQGVQRQVQRLVLEAAVVVRTYAATYPDLDPAFVIGVVDALGTISVEEALDAIDREAGA